MPNNEKSKPSPKERIKRAAEHALEALKKAINKAEVELKPDLEVVKKDLEEIKDDPHHP